MTYISGLVLCFIMVCIAIGIFIFVLDKLSQPKDSNTFSTTSSPVTESLCRKSTEIYMIVFNESFFEAT